jgi:hypothetical protein
MKLAVFSAYLLPHCEVAVTKVEALFEQWEKEEMITMHSVTPRLPPEWPSSASGADGHGPNFCFPTRIEDGALAYMIEM